jgi:PAS domain S-box-containing protein
MAELIKILVVDDNPHMLKGLTRLFRINGFEVQEAVNGRSAIDTARDSQPDLILLDVNLPDINGIEVCRRLKSEPATSGIFIVHLSAMHTNSSSQVEGLEAGADGYIVQPISNQELLARIQALSRIITAEKELHLRKQEFEALVQNAPDLIARIDSDLTYSYVNPAVERVFGKSEEQILGRTNVEIDLAGSSVSEMDDNIRRVLAGEGEKLVTIGLGDSSQPAWYQVRIAPEKDTHGNVSSVLCIFNDVTERKIAEEEVRSLNRDLGMRVEQRTKELAIINHELEAEVAVRKNSEEALRQRTIELAQVNSKLAKASRLKDEFLSSMSHELRTPLIAVLGISEALQEEVYGEMNEKQQKSLKTIEESGRHLLSLINDILDISKIEAGKMELQIAPVSVESLCQTSIQFIRHAAVKKNLELCFHPETISGKVIGDERKLRQILINLLSNAVKFTEESGQIGLAVDTDPELEAVEITVWDTGIGIEHDQLEQMFQPFVQLDSSLSRQYNGTGLGLSIVKKLMDLHGGSIRLESTPGKGTRFTVRLSWIDDNDEAKHSEIEQSIDISDFPDTKSIMVIQGENSDYEQINGYLRDVGIEAKFLQSGNGYMNYLKEQQPDLIILDFRLADDAADVMKSLREQKALNKIPLILTSLNKSANNADNSTYDAYLSKPFVRQQFYHALKSSIGASSNGLNGNCELINGKNGVARFKILACDDNPRVIRYLSEYARRRDIELILVDSSEELLRSASEETPDLIILDYSLEGPDGLETVRTLREGDDLKKIPVIITTGHDLPGYMEKAIAAGADMYMVKPISTGKLDQIVQVEGKSAVIESGV